jgi:hypothetical protein
MRGNIRHTTPDGQMQTALEMKMIVSANQDESAVTDLVLLAFCRRCIRSV